MLGNKQLFSLLFIVFILLGVFFAMGYVMGRNTSGGTDVAVRPPAGNDTPASRGGRPSAAEGSMPPVIERPATAAAEPPAQKGEPEATAQPPAAAAKVPPQTESGPPAVIDPKPGQIFLQVSAVARPEAELLVEVLTKKGFKAAMAPGPNDQVFRVLVGPSPNEADLGKMRTDLEQSGFKTMVRRY